MLGSKKFRGLVLAETLLAVYFIHNAVQLPCALAIGLQKNAYTEIVFQ